MIEQRIKTARALAGLTMRELAKRVGVSHQAIGKYEKGTAIPSSNILLRLSKELGVGIEYLMRPQTIRLSQIKFRKKKSALKKTLLSIDAAVRDRLERYMLVESFLPEPEPACLPRFTIEDAAKTEQCAHEWRRAWKLGSDPIDNLVEMAEAHGVKVVLIAPPAPGFDGCAVWIDDQKPALVVNQTLTHCRFRLTFAHELAHILLDLPDHWTTKQQEDAAFRLGAAFLVPDDAVYLELGLKRRTLDFDELCTLKQVYGMSVQAWVTRAWQLGIIGDTTKDRLFRAIGARGWRLVEPGDAPTKERSRRFERLLLRVVAEDIISEARAAEVCGKPLAEFRKELAESQLDTAGAGH